LLPLFSPSFLSFVPSARVVEGEVDTIVRLTPSHPPCSGVFLPRVGR